MKTIHQLDTKDLTGIVAAHFGVSRADVFIKSGRTTVGTGDNRRTEYAINCTVTIDDRQHPEETPEPEPAVPAEADPEPEPEDAPPSSLVTEDKPEGVKGFVRLFCPDCGNGFGVFLREYQTDIACKCGHVFDLTAPLAKYRFTCPYCYKEGYGKTNATGADVTVRCVCKEDLTLEWNPAAREYRN